MIALILLQLQKWITIYTLFVHGRDEMLQFMKDKYYQEGDLIVTKMTRRCDVERFVEFNER